MAVVNNSSNIQIESTNIFAGNGAGNLTTTGTNLTAYGPQALNSVTTATQCVAIGAGALQSTTGNGQNVAIGYQSMQNANCVDSVAIGVSSLSNDTHGQNVAIGASALNANTTGGNNIAIGAAAMSGANANNDVAIGAEALLLDTGGNNVAVGTICLNVNTTGTQNTGIGAQCLSLIRTGTDNTCVGFNTGSNYNSSESNNVLIGSNLNGTAGESNVTRIGNGSTSCFIAGIEGVSVSNQAITTINTSTNQLGSVSAVPVANGGTGVSSWTDTNSLLVTGTTSTGSVQDIASVATGEVLISQGTSTKPAWSATPSVTSITLGAGNALSTYVEGTFTPGIAFGGSSTGITYSNQNGIYRQIGKVVFFSVVIVMTAVGSATGNATLTGLPVAGASGNQRDLIAETQNFTYTTNYTNLSWVSAASTNFTLVQFGAGVNAASATNTNFSATTQLRFIGFYFT